MVMDTLATHGALGYPALERGPAHSVTLTGVVVQSPLFPDPSFSRHRYLLFINWHDYADDCSKGFDYYAVMVSWLSLCKILYMDKLK